MKCKWLIDRIVRLFVMIVIKSPILFLYRGYLIHLILTLYFKNPTAIICFCRVIRFSTLEWLSSLSSIQCSIDEKIESPQNFLSKRNLSNIANLYHQYPWMTVRQFFSATNSCRFGVMLVVVAYWTDNFNSSRTTNKNDSLNSLKNN